MKSKAIFGLFTFVVAVLGIVAVSAESAEAKKVQHVPVTICHATGAQDKWVRQTVDDDSILNEQHVPTGNGHAVHQDGRDIIPPFTTTDGFNFPGKNWDTAGQAIYNNSCVKPGTTTPDVCDPSQQPSGSIAKWLRDSQVSGADCFSYEVTNICGLLNVNLTKYPIFAGKPYRAVYTTNGTVSLPASTFPAVFGEDANGGSVDVTWFIVGPEKDYLIGTGLPNYWDGNGQTLTVNTDCEEESTPADIAATLKCATVNEQMKIELTLKNDGETDGEAVVNGKTVPVAAGATVTEYFAPGTKVTVVFNNQTILSETLACVPGRGGDTPKTPETPKNSDTPITLPNTFGAATPLVAAGALTLAGLILVAGSAIKSRLLV